MIEGYRYADQWNPLTLRPAASKPYLSEAEAEARYERREGAIEIVPEPFQDSGVPRWSMRALRDGAFVVKHYNREGSVTRLAGFREYDGRLFHDEVIDYLYPDESRRLRLSEALSVVTAYIKPDGTSKIITKDSVSGESSVAEYRNVAIDTYWAQRPAFGAWETLADPNFGDSPSRMAEPAAGAGYPWAEVREQLRTSRIPDQAVQLPGDDGIPWEGALHIAGPDDGAWTLSTVDYGRSRTLLTRRDEVEVVTALYDYLLTPLPESIRIADDEHERMLAWAAPHILDLANRAGSGRLVIDAPAGLLLDRIGALDGFLLYPTGTSFEARSLPPTVLDQPLRSFVTAAPIRVGVEVTPPWFGRPGGGVRFELQEAGVGIRDLIREGRLTQLAS